MSEKRFRFGICSDNAPLIEQFKKAAVFLSVDLEVSLYCQAEAVPHAKQMESAGVELILAGAQTGTILRQQVSIPVTDVGISIYDMIHNLIKAAEKSKKIIFPLHTSVGMERRIISDALNIQIDSVSFKDETTARILLEKAKDQGYELVIGSGYVCRYAREIGLSVQEFNRTDTSVQDTLDKAIATAKSNREIRESERQIRAILDSSPDGVIAVNDSGDITAINKKALELLDIQAAQAIHHPVVEIIPKTTIKEALKNDSFLVDSIEIYNNKTFIWNHQPFGANGKVSGCVSTFREASSVMRSENKIRRTLSRGHVARYTIDDLIHQSAAMKKTVADANKYAGTNSNLLVTGETGTGKEVLVQSIHNLSARKNMPFVSINCAAMPEQLLESELFGYTEGAFTGSRKGGKPGLFELAHKGTIFLDEIGETSESMQSRLLRVLQEREIMRLGDDRLISIDVRVMAASNRDLAEAVRNKRFRSDLFFRLNILQIKIPPLRFRAEDIPVLLDSFIQTYSSTNELRPFSIPPALLERLKTYAWPGNVRQLQNFAERLVLISDSRFDRLVFEELFNQLFDYQTEPDNTQEVLNNDTVRHSISNEESIKPEEKAESLKEQIKVYTVDKETEILKKALEEARYSRAKVAKNLGVSRSTLWRKMKKAGLV